MLGYFDESYHPLPQLSDAFTVAGFVGTAEGWKRFKTEWQAVLTSYNVSSFHSSDFYNSHREFDGWRRPEKQQLEGELLSIIVRNTIVGVTASAFQGEHTSIFLPALTRDEDRILYREPYILCTETCARLLHRHMASNPILAEDERIECVFDRNDQHAGRLSDHWPRFKVSYPWAGEVLGELTFGSRLEVIPLQAADLIAYESFKYYEKYHFGRRPAGIRQSFKHLLGSDRMFGGWYPPEGLREEAERINAHPLPRKLPRWRLP